MSILKKKVIVNTIIAYTAPRAITIEDKSLAMGDQIVYGTSTTIIEVNRFQRKPIAVNIIANVINPLIPKKE